MDDGRQTALAPEDVWRRLGRAYAVYTEFANRLAEHSRNRIPSPMFANSEEEYDALEAAQREYWRTISQLGKLRDQLKAVSDFWEAEAQEVLADEYVRRFVEGG